MKKTETNKVTNTAINALDFIKGKFADEEGVAYDIIADIARISACCDAEIDLAEADGDSIIIRMTAACRIVDNGIGEYEYWGSRCVDHRYEPECDERAFAIAIDDKYLASIGLVGTATEDGDVDYSDCEEDGDAATCTERVTLYVTDPAKFYLFVDKAIAKMAVSKAA